MALQTLPTFTPSGYLDFTTALVSPPSYTTFSGIFLSNPALVAAPTAYAMPSGSAPDKVLIDNRGPDDCVVLIAAAAATTTGTATAGSTALTVASGTSIAVGQVVVGAGVAPGTTVAAVASTAVTLSQPTTAALSTTAVSFVTAVTLNTGTAAMARVPLVLNYVSSGFICALCFNGAGRSQLAIAVGV